MFAVITVASQRTNMCDFFVTAQYNTEDCSDVLVGDRLAAPLKM